MSTMHPTNRLAKETSPYLLQHQHNPVDWHPWGHEALELAKAEDKPIIVSIGYSACHWCHVMERESFENETIAAIMNKYFVCIKIDREERPDVDQIYMEAVQAMGLQGGWPLNVFLTPTQQPFYGGTYFPPKGWAQLLQNIAKAFEEQREEIEKSAVGFTESLNRSETERLRLTEAERQFTQAGLDQMYKRLQSRFDPVHGGMTKAPKFPMPSIWRFLLRYYHESEDRVAQEHLVLTLDAMAAGGIYDQVGGGFARYSVDGEWFAPHFEKMLYDNGQLLTLYAEAYKVTQKPLYRQVILDTIAWANRELRSEENAYYSALDADSERVEGKFYTYTAAEIKELSGDHFDLIADYYRIKPEGNWEEGRNILHYRESDSDFTKRHQISTDHWQQVKSDFATKCMALRAQRIRPGLDDKVISGWNGLMLKGLIDSYDALGDQAILEDAIANADFICDQMIDGATLYRTYKDGRAKINGFLEDYALVSEGLMALYEATFDEKWLHTAQALVEEVLKSFYDKEDGLFFYTSASDEQLIARKKEIFDNVIPASNSVMAKVLHRLGTLLDNSHYTELANSMVSRISDWIVNETQDMANWALVYANMRKPLAEIAILGKEANAFQNEMSKRYLPEAVFLGTATKSDLPLLKERSAINSDTTIFVCFEKACRLPVHSVNEALVQLNS